MKMQSTTKQTEEERGVPLRDVVADCARHSFKDYLKKANNEDVDAQMIVGKMYCAGYGVNKDLQKVVTFTAISSFFLCIPDLDDSFVWPGTRMDKQSPMEMEKKISQTK